MCGMRLLGANLGSGFAMRSARLLSANFGSERLRHDTRPSLRSNRRSAQQSYHGYTALRTSSMARAARPLSSKHVVEDAGALDEGLIKLAWSTLHSQNNTLRVLSFVVMPLGFRAINTKAENKNGSDR